MLPTVDGLDDGAWQVRVSADTGCLRLAGLLFDSELELCSAIDVWTGLVTGRPYALDPDLLAT
jgi:hypothetical protein